ncbi:dipeptidase [Cupriavidus consociatus]|uniref:dipeptidase n=1 Tax=Cupriavidus consociatus TaxID=2821357 RepID=UPI001AE8EE64|nr:MULTISPECIES: membrane dipeptidase [unclassified Cupriavidus]MBP0625203.1 membrane dipeptidase [Cupriavidus sp. LEh25]MDK2661943.1 membrane dipeptidase [Cupriavidus sp. LEh21]
MKPNSVTRRRLLLGVGTLAATRGVSKVWAQRPATLPLFMDGHVHITNRVYWEKAEFWQPQPGNWDYGRARASGINCIVDNLGTYGAWNYNYAPKMFLRLIETALRYAEQHKDKMAIVTTTADARRVIASGRMAVFLGSESGWDHEGDLDVLGAFYRLGLRSIQFATQTGFNAFADSEIAPQQGGQKSDHYHGINQKGRALIAEMNRLGMLVDITHGTNDAQRQLIEASKAPVVCSHVTMKTVAGVGMTDENLKLLASKGGVVGIHGGAAVVGKRYRKWMTEHPVEAKKINEALRNMLGYQPSQPRQPGDHGEYIEMFDREFGHAWRANGGWKELPELQPLVPTADEWAEQVDHVIKTVGADHVGIGLDMADGRSGVPRDAGGYGEILAALKKITTPANVTKICGENWFRVLDSAKA